MANYKIGFDDPPLTPDKGAGAHGSRPAELKMHAFKAAIRAVLPAARAYPGPDAARHMAHYLDNTGADLTIPFQRMVHEVADAEVGYRFELQQAMAFVEGLPEGAHAVTSAELSHGYNTPQESKNWYFAVGGYASWGKGVARVSRDASYRNYELQFEYRFFDRYNWDGGKSVELAGVTITDDQMGELHRQGLAREFNCFGGFTGLHSWGGPVPPPAVPPLPRPPAKKPPTTVPPVTSPPPPVLSPMYTVRSGDTLSRIARAYYGQASYWPRIYAANRAVIGPNPDLIYPGQRLVIP